MSIILIYPNNDDEEEEEAVDDDNDDNQFIIMISVLTQCINYYLSIHLSIFCFDTR